MGVIRADSREEWAAAASASFVPLEVSSVADQFSGSIDHHPIGRIALSKVVSQACRVVRTTTLIDSSADDDLLFSLQLRGTNVVEQRQRTATIGPGQGVLYFSGMPYTLDFPEQSDALILQVSRERIGLSRERLAALVAQPINVREPGLRVYASFASTLFDEVRSESGNAHAPLGAIAADLLAEVLWQLSEAAPAPHLSGVALERIRRFIRDHLTDARLDVGMIARSHGISIRSVHAAFEGFSMTPAHYIRSERLRLAAERMTATDSPVVDIAISVGFSDVTTFTRAFHRHYGSTPAAYRAGQRSR